MNIQTQANVNGFFVVDKLTWAEVSLSTTDRERHRSRGRQRHIHTNRQAEKGGGGVEAHRAIEREGERNEIQGEGGGGET